MNMGLFQYLPGRCFWDCCRDYSEWDSRPKLMQLIMRIICFNQPDIVTFGDGEWIDFCMGEGKIVESGPVS